MRRASVTFNKDAELALPRRYRGDALALVALQYFRITYEGARRCYDVCLSWSG